MGGLGVSSAHDIRRAAYVASFLSCLPRMRLFSPFLSRLDPEHDTVGPITTMRDAYTGILHDLSQ
eukprot:3085742-Pleurochrysis_carterae.AAC.1